MPPISQKKRHKHSSVPASQGDGWGVAGGRSKRSGGARDWKGSEQQGTQSWNQVSGQQ